MALTHGAEDPGRMLDALLGLLRVAIATGYSATPEIHSLARELHARALEKERGVSEVGSGEAVRETISPVVLQTPDEAGRAVGLTGRRVRQLCADGLVDHQKVGANRYLVDLDDLQRHLRGDAA